MNSINAIRSKETVNDESKKNFVRYYTFLVAE